MTLSAESRLQAMQPWLRKVGRLGQSKMLVWMIVAAGLALRTAYYLVPRSIWYDEARLSLNIVNRSLPELLQPLDHNQAAPIGFLAIERFAVVALGNSEQALRLFPFLCGVAALLFFPRVATGFVGPRARPLAVFLLAFSPWLIYYSAETKQYSSDAALALAMYAAMPPALTPPLTARRACLLGILGAAGVWVSHPLVFVLAGLGTTLFVCRCLERAWSEVAKLVALALAWGASFGVLYVVSLGTLSQSSYFLGYFRRSFMPLPPTSLSDVMWFPDTLMGIFQRPGGLPASLSGLAALIFLVGCVSAWSQNRRRFLLLVSPALFALLASGLQTYPFTQRFLLFLLPMVFLLVAEGALVVRSEARQGLALVGVVTMAFLLFYPLVSTASLLRNGTLDRVQNAEIRAVMDYLQRHRRPGDVVYLHSYAGDAFRYYARRYGFEGCDCIYGVWTTHVLEDLAGDLDRVRGRERAWIVFSQTYWTNYPEVRKFALYYLNQHGRQLDAFRSDGAEVFLYDLSVTAR